MLDRKFKIGTTSFIIPDHIIPNVQKLGPFFDEIELLVFESQPLSVLPTVEDVAVLKELSVRFDLAYNIHLPVDISLSKGSEDEYKTACEILLIVLDRFKPLNPTTHTLHLEMPDEVRADLDDEKRLMDWKGQVNSRLDLFLNQVENPKSLSIETLNYDFAMIETMTRSHQLPICIDIGHGIKYDYDWKTIYHQNRDQVPIVHLHGVDFSQGLNRDHTRLDVLPDRLEKELIGFLTDYTGTVSIEVFNKKNLASSMEWLSKYFSPINFDQSGLE